MLFYKFIIFYYLLKLSSCIEVNTELKLVQILFRHGDRSAVQTYPNDIYNETIWDKYGGFGQLTQTGMRQHHTFGTYLRNRYFGFFDIIYNKNKISVRSTDYDRTLMSAYSLLSGLFLPVDYQEWNPFIQWQPIPVHTTDAKNDQIFYSNYCPRLAQLKAEVQSSPEYKQINNKHRFLLNLITNNTGLKNMSLVDLWKVGDTLFCQKTHGFRLPNWAEPYYENIVRALKWGFYFDYRLTEMGILQSGGVLNEMRKNIMTKVNTDSLNQLYLYSGHDTYVAGLVKLLNLTEINQPPYVSAVIVELRKEINTDSNYFVQVYYKNNTANEPINYQPMTVYGCDTLCPLEQFLDITKDLVVANFSIACKIK